MEKVVYGIFLFVLIFSPLAFGTVEQWSMTVMEAMSFLALLLLLLGNIRSKGDLYEIPGIVPLVLFLAYVLMQLVPLPAGVVGFLSPKTHAMYAETVAAAGPPGWIPLTIGKKATLMEFFRIAAGGAVYVLTVQLLWRRRLLRKTIFVVVVFSSCLAFLGILQHILSGDRIFWLREIPDDASPFGPFVNRNHYAGLMEMVFPLGLGLLLFYGPRSGDGSLHRKISDIFSHERSGNHILMLFCAVLIATSVFVSLSRGGIASMCLSMAFFVWFLGRGTAGRRFGVIAFVIVLTALSAGWFGWEAVFERFGGTITGGGGVVASRPTIWKDSLEIIKDFPLIGSGLGSFALIYPMYRSFSGFSVATHAHNDYVELLSEGGIIAFLLAGWFIFSVLFGSYASLRRRNVANSAHVFIGCVTGVVAMLIHSLADFNLHIGANGMYFFFLLGLVVSSGRAGSGVDGTRLKKSGVPLRAVGVTAAVLLLTAIVFNAGVLAAGVRFSYIDDAKLGSGLRGEDLITIRAAAADASRLDPLEAEYHYIMGRVGTLLGQPDGALNLHRRSAVLEPANAGYIQRLGLAYSSIKEYKDAERLLRAGVKYDPKNPLRYEAYASWLLMRGDREGGLRNMREAISLDPSRTGKCITAMVLGGLSDGEITGALPERAVPHLVFAEYLYNTGSEGMADGSYLNALDYLRNEESVEKLFFIKVFLYYNKKGRYEDALRVMLKAEEFFPEDAGIRRTVASLHERLGKDRGAVQE
jgi:O-antigen ligase/tetratricopeptide (TPR) repeat protein